MKSLALSIPKDLALRDRHNWNFSGVPAMEHRAACIYEYARESRLIRGTTTTEAREAGLVLPPSGALLVPFFGHPDRLAQAQVQAQQRLDSANAALFLKTPTLDDNLLAIGRQHAPLGATVPEVEACYGGPGEELSCATDGVSLRAYHLNALCVCVSFWQGRSFQEVWTKASAELKPIFSFNSAMSILENKTPGYRWLPVKSSSDRFSWWASPLGLVACYEIPDSAKMILHIADRRRAAPSTLPALPAAALAALPALPAALSPSPRPKMSSFGIFLVVLMLVLGALAWAASLPRPAAPAQATAAPKVLRALPVKPTPAPPRALPVYAPETAASPSSSSTPKGRAARHRRD